MPQKNPARAKRKGPPRRPPNVATEGHRQMFVVRDISNADIARTCGVTAELISQWRRGKLPGRPTRELLGRAYNVRPEDWDRAPFSDEQPQKPPAPSEGEGNGSTPTEPATRATLIAELQKMLPTLPAGQKMQAIERLARLCASEEEAQAERATRIEAMLSGDEWRGFWRRVAGRLDAATLGAVEQAIKETMEA